MKIIDRYLLKQFLQIFVVCFLSLMGLYTVIDAFSHLDSFSDYAKEHGSLLGVIAEFYAYKSIGFFDRTSGILAMIAAMFTVTWLQRHQELTALLAAGVTKTRVVMPLILVAVVISFLSAASRETVIPRFRDQLTRSTKDLGGSKARELQARFDAQTDILISGQRIITAEGRIVGPTFVLPKTLDRYGRQLNAADAYYREANSTQPAGYLLKEVSTPAEIDQLASLKLRDRPIIITPRDASWLNPGEAFVVSQLPFHLLANGTAWRDYASTSELIEEMGSPSTKIDPDVRVAVHSRVLQPLKDTTLLMLGLPLMFSRRNRNIFLSIGICMLVAVAFTLVSLACQSFGGLGMLRPTLAAWLPLLLFIPVAVAMSHSLRT